MLFINRPAILNNTENIIYIYILDIISIKIPFKSAVTGVFMQSCVWVNMHSTSSVCCYFKVESVLAALNRPGRCLCSRVMCLSWPGGFPYSRSTQSYDCVGGSELCCNACLKFPTTFCPANTPRHHSRSRNSKTSFLSFKKVHFGAFLSDDGRHTCARDPLLSNF